MRSLTPLAALAALTALPSPAPAAGEAAPPGPSAGRAAGSAPGARQTPSPDIPSILQAMYQAYGDRERLASFPGFRARGRVLSVSDGVSGTLRLAVDLRGSMRVEIRYPERTEVRILTGALSWVGGRRNQHPCPPSMTEAMRLHFHRLAAPFELAAADVGELEPAGISEEGWVALRRRWGEGEETIYEIDPQEGWIRRVRGFLRTGEEELAFVTESRDFRQVAGVMFPHRMTTRIAGRVAAETVLDRVREEETFEVEEFLPALSGGDL